MRPTPRLACGSLTGTLGESSAKSLLGQDRDYAARVSRGPSHECVSTTYLVAIEKVRPGPSLKKMKINMRKPLEAVLMNRMGETI